MKLLTGKNNKISSYGFQRVVDFKWNVLYWVIHRRLSDGKTLPFHSRTHKPDLYYKSTVSRNELAADLRELRKYIIDSMKIIALGGLPITPLKNEIIDFLKKCPSEKFTYREIAKAINQEPLLVYAALKELDEMARLKLPAFVDQCFLVKVCAVSGEKDMTYKVFSPFGSQ